MNQTSLVVLCLAIIILLAGILWASLTLFRFARAKHGRRIKRIVAKMPSSQLLLLYKQLDQPDQCIPYKESYIRAVRNEAYKRKLVVRKK
ncbi:MAG: hypothetical protein E7019_00930 [Alphaproteobacteria bacterium]|nr:hypothetical protein [Alphaproteobacteria bacterium]